MENKNVRVGVGVVIFKEGKVLLGKRKNAHGEGSWSFPGGHLEYGEQVEDCAIREVMEETGLEVKFVKRLDFTNDIFEKEDKHYITLFVLAKIVGGKLENKEPHKLERWEWCVIDNLPSPLFLAIEHLIKQGFDFKELRDEY